MQLSKGRLFFPQVPPKAENQETRFFPRLKGSSYLRLPVEVLAPLLPLCFTCLTQMCFREVLPGWSLTPFAQVVQGPVVSTLAESSLRHPRSGSGSLPPPPNSSSNVVIGNQEMPPKPGREDSSQLPTSGLFQEGSRTVIMALCQANYGY